MDNAGIHMDGVSIHVDGDRIQLDGVIIHMDNASIHMDGVIIHLDGASIQLDGAVIHMDGASIHYTGGFVHWTVQPYLPRSPPIPMAIYRSMYARAFRRWFQVATGQRWAHRPVALQAAKRKGPSGLLVFRPRGVQASSVPGPLGRCLRQAGLRLVVRGLSGR